MREAAESESYVRLNEVLTHGYHLEVLIQGVLALAKAFQLDSVHEEMCVWKVNFCQRNTIC